MDKNLIAPCGINCGLCLAYLRDKNKCKGCRKDDIGKPTSRYNCIIKTCVQFSDGKSKFCFECSKFPCRRLKQLNKRYSSKYNTSPIDNLLMIKEKGIMKFLKDQKKKWTCLQCNGSICMHRNRCLQCQQ